jgi:hypothetical protein
MPYVRVTRDQRGYENTFLLHSSHPGQRAAVVYWYRSAPGVRVGRAAFDEDAIRTIEERHPDVEFDWGHLIEEASSVPPEVERPPERGGERRRRKAERRDSAAPELEPVPMSVDQNAAPPQELTAAVIDEDAPAAPSQPATPPNPLLEQLVGREIARRLRQRYTELLELIVETAPDEPTRSQWHERAAPLDPDRWNTPQDILHGVEHADQSFGRLRDELGARPR